MRLLPILLLLVFPAYGAAQVGSNPSRFSEIAVLGEGETRVAPEKVSIQVSALTNDSTASAAGARNAATVVRLRAALGRLGIRDLTITEAGYSVRARTRYEAGKEHQEGYTATQTLNVQTRDVSQAGLIIDTALRAGATQIQGVSFSVARSSALRAEALRQAVTHARAEAEVIARAAGGRLGRLIQVSTNRSDASPGVYVYEAPAARAVRDEATSVVPTDVVVRAVVTARWEFIDG